MAGRTRRSSHLPAETSSFIGRRRELATLRKKLGTARLLSLVGPGGVGKTRLAIRAASDLERGFSGGAWLVELGEVQDAGLVPNAMMAALDLRDQTATEPAALLLSYLRDKELLLVVDNCEHLLGTVATLVSEVIRAAPGVRVIATSREPLSVAGEHVIPIPPLQLPAAHGAEPLDQLRQNEAVGLFVERADASSGRFELTPANQAAVADLCRRLDGLPLAIELAAVRTRALTPEQIIGRMTNRFALLTGGRRGALPRHQTLMTTIDWSHELLAEGERALLRRLSVFAGGFTLEDVESVCATDDMPAMHPLDLLSSLVNKSLVMKDDTRTTPCFRLHETMREYSRLKLREAGEEEGIELRFAIYYTSKCQRSALESSSRLVEWLTWMDLEIDNIRSVLQRCLAHENFARGIDLAASLGWYWITRGRTEGVRWLDELLASEAGKPDARARVYFIRGYLAVFQTDPTGAIPALERAIALARESGQLTLLAQSLAVASTAKNMAGDRATAEQLLDEVRALASDRNDPAAALAFSLARSFKGLFDADVETVRLASSEVVRRSREAGDLYTLEVALINLAFASLIAGDFEEGKPIFEEGLRIAHQIDDRVAQYYMIGASGCQAARSGQARLSAQLLGAAETIRIGAGASVIAFLVPLLAQAQKTAIATLGRSKFDTEFNAGAALTREAAIRTALGEPARIAAATSDAGSPMLGKRQEEIARLVANGLTNKQIGARLFISEHTVESHVRSIMNKLGVHSRTQIAAWIASLAEPAERSGVFGNHPSRDRG